jgi:DNA polymerase-3 subunit chi
MQLDFWQLSHGTVPAVVAQIAARVIAAGDRLLVVDGDDARRAETARALWEAPGFLANGELHAARQPVLLSAECAAANGATIAVLADGTWRDEAIGFARAILVFGEGQVEAARAVWRQFDGRADVVRGYMAQEGGKWVKKA